MLKQLAESIVPYWHHIINKRARINGEKQPEKLALNKEQSMFVLSSRFSGYRIPESQLAEFDRPSSGSDIIKVTKSQGVE